MKKFQIGERLKSVSGVDWTVLDYYTGGYKLYSHNSGNTIGHTDQMVHTAFWRPKNPNEILKEIL